MHSSRNERAAENYVYMYIRNEYIRVAHARVKLMDPLIALLNIYYTYCTSNSLASRKFGPFSRSISSEGGEEEAKLQARFVPAKLRALIFRLISRNSSGHRRRGFPQEREVSRRSITRRCPIPAET